MIRVPVPYLRLCQAWGLSPLQAEQLWLALVRSREPRAATWCEALVQCEAHVAQQAAAQPFVATWCEALAQCAGEPGVPTFALLARWPPQAVLAVIDTLRCAHQLSRRTRVEIEESILRQVDRLGGWKDLPAPDLAAVMDRYWR
jgi:hypothetical protein